MYYKYDFRTGVQKIHTKTKASLSTLGLLLGGGVMAVAVPVAVHANAVACTPTGFIRDGINLTAARMGGEVTGDVDAGGCNIGVYINSTNPGSVEDANIYGANYYGVVVDGASADTTNSTVSSIGETPFNGSQHGLGIAYVNGASGDVSSNTVSQYQKGGIVASGENTIVSINGNTVTGLGPVKFIAQNGIQVSSGAAAREFDGNVVTGNVYTQGAQKGVVSTGVLFYQAGTSPKVGDIASSNRVYANQSNVTIVK